MQLWATTIRQDLLDVSLRVKTARSSLIDALSNVVIVQPGTVSAFLAGVEDHLELLCEVVIRVFVVWMLSFLLSPADFNTGVGHRLLLL